MIFQAQFFFGGGGGGGRGIDDNMLTWDKIFHFEKPQYSRQCLYQSYIFMIIYENLP